MRLTQFKVNYSPMAKKGYDFFAVGWLLFHLFLKDVCTVKHLSEVLQASNTTTPVTIFLSLSVLSHWNLFLKECKPERFYLLLTL